MKIARYIIYGLVGCFIASLWADFLGLTDIANLIGLVIVNAFLIAVGYAAYILLR